MSESLRVCLSECLIVCVRVFPSVTVCVFFLCMLLLCVHELGC